MKKEKKIWFNNVDKASEIAIYFGFKPENDLVISEKETKLAQKIIKKDQKIKTETGIRKTEDLLGVLSDYIQDTKKQTTCLSIFKKKTRADKKHQEILLEIINDGKSFSDILIIRTALLILKETTDYKKLKLYINSLGDRESIARFTREFHNYYKKNLNRLTITCQNNWKIDPYGVLNCHHDMCRKIAENSPKPFGYLSENSRRYFKEVLEGLEKIEIEYEFNEKMTTGKPFGSQTLFIIKNQKGELVAEGGRYNNLAKKIIQRRELPSVGVTLIVPTNSSKMKKNIPKPEIFLIQIGQEAKIKSLKIIEELRKIKIPIMQSLTNDKMSSQLGLAEKYKTPYAMIIGQQESLEDVVILQDLKSREQHTIPINKLTTEIKKFLK